MKEELETYQPTEDVEQEVAFSAEEEQEYQDWYDNVFSKMSEEEQRQELLRLVKENVTETDGKVIDRILGLLKDHQGEDTDMVFFMNNLKEDFPDINPSSIVSYMMLLKSCGLVDVDLNDGKNVNLTFFDGLKFGG